MVRVKSTGFIAGPKSTDGKMERKHGSTVIV